jgi:hydroxyacid-oxoacid transhydrogenase
MPRLTFGRGCLSELGERIKSHGVRRAALITDRFLAASQHVERARQSLDEAGVDYDVFDEIRIEPSDASVMDASRFLTQGDFDGLVSVGGGSVMDTAKAAAVYARYPASFSSYFAPPIGDGVPVPGPVIPHIACPTTSGTGSEMTGLSVIRLMEHDTKFVLASRYILPDEALVDSACSDTLPSRVMASTGFDLLSHAIECYTARAYTHWDKIRSPGARPMIQGANPWSDLHAREALRIADAYLVRGVDDAGDHEARDNLMWAATLAGMAFGNCGTHLPHAFSYGVTHLMRNVVTDDYPVPSPFVPHGISVILTSPSVFRFSARGAPERHMEAAACLGADTRDATPDDAGEIVATRIVELMRATQLPNGLQAIGFAAADANALADSAMRQRRAIGNAPRETTRDDASEIFKSAAPIKTRGHTKADRSIFSVNKKGTDLFFFAAYSKKQTVK